MTASEKITVWLAQVRSSGRAVVYARLVIAATGTIALVVPAIQPWDQLDLVPILGVPLLLTTVVLPDSFAGLMFLLVVAIGWLIRAPATLTAGVAITAVALVVLHLATAFTAQLPSYARLTPKSLRRWWLPTTIAAVLAPTTALATALIHHANLPGSLAITTTATLLTATTIWLTTTQSPNHD
ncbi:hypothetical protein [Kribbella solani]|uniref:Uncharacterized protein n=1 Tax=Kribbella solani TaxID=236067 RepID=A0A841DUQ7_9ACTN|nr:hypothetical protein [Kribbella solani]MBB5980605.1 hypothetical protein [Kribbella solani]MDX2968852.1 hypothetical protein [Kribbella solani]MDX3002641.1 hypothetical protein [Kribbella solani]